VFYGFLGLDFVKVEIGDVLRRNSKIEAAVESQVPEKRETLPSLLSRVIRQWKPCHPAGDGSGRSIR
jgi:hypothetical protein